MRDAMRDSAHTGGRSSIVDENIKDSIMAKSQLKGNREAKKPKQPKKAVTTSAIAIPVKPI